MGRKWNNIKYQKAANDKQRSKIYSKFGIEIYAAAKSEPDPEINRNLKMVIEKAKTYNVPREIIERAIEKAKVLVVKITLSIVMKVMDQEEVLLLSIA